MQAETEAEAPVPIAAAQPVIPAEASASNTGLRDALLAAWKQLLPETTKAMTDPARKAAVEPLVQQFQALAKAGSFEQAKPLLDRLTAALQQRAATSPAAEDQKAKLMAEWNRLKPALTQAVADPARRGGIESMTARFKQEFQGGKLDDARKTLGALENLAQGVSKPAAAAGGREEEFQRRWTAAKQIFRSSMETIDEQLNKLAGKMRGVNDADFKAIADRGLPALTGNHKTPVMRALFELDGPPGAARVAAAGKAKAAIGAFRSHAASSPQMKTLDEHAQAAFGVATTLRSQIDKGLAALDQALGTLDTSQG